MSMKTKQETEPDRDAALDAAFDALGRYDVGVDPSALRPIDAALRAAHDDAAALARLEERLAAVLGTAATRTAKDFACRRLSRIATARSAPALAALLADGELSHMARWALERMPCAEAAAVLRAALETTKGWTLVGVIDSLGVRRDGASAPPLARLLARRDVEFDVAEAALAALGRIGTKEASAALDDFRARCAAELRAAVADASLSCAERLAAAGEKERAGALLDALRDDDAQPARVRAAAARARGEIGALR